MTTPFDSLSRKRILITGGLGMLGSTIARKLVSNGADVTILDACIEPYGANLFNLKDIENSVKVNISDIRDRESMKYLVRDKDIIFNLAGQVSHNDSMNNPFLDTDINYLGHLNVLECLRNYNPKAVVLHAGSRLQFGKIQEVPVKEDHPLNPRTPYALNKASAENMYLFYHNIHGIPCVLFRISNPYGPRSQMKHNKYSMINWFLRLAMEDSVISIFGDGNQIRDYIFVDDLADAFIAASVQENCFGQVFNVGSGVGTKFREMVNTILEIVGRGKVKYVPWPKDYQNVETGDYIADIRKLCGITGWSAMTDLTTGIHRTFAYYNQYKSSYW